MVCTHIDCSLSASATAYTHVPWRICGTPRHISASVTHDITGPVLHHELSCAQSSHRWQASL